MKQHLKTKMAEFHRVLVSSALNRSKAWTFHFAIYLPSIGYPLPICHFSKSELDLLHKKVMGEMIARCGYCRRTKWEIIYGPASLEGACFRHPYGKQGTGQILFLHASPYPGLSSKQELENQYSSRPRHHYLTSKHAGSNC
jgi:hypothetical protein